MKIDLNNKGASAKCKGNSFDVGGNVHVPDGFPSALQPPSNAKVYDTVDGEAGRQARQGDG